MEMEQMLELLLGKQAAPAKIGRKIDVYLAEMRAWPQKIDAETDAIRD
jgi:hypothetical protein